VTGDVGYSFFVSKFVAFYMNVKLL